MEDTRYWQKKMCKPQEKFTRTDYAPWQILSRFFILSRFKTYNLPFKTAATLHRRTVEQNAFTVLSDYKNRIRETPVSTYNYQIRRICPTFIAIYAHCDCRISIACC